MKNVILSFEENIWQAKVLESNEIFQTRNITEIREYLDFLENKKPSKDSFFSRIWKK